MCASELRMATYPGMSLGGEVRESISLDEDDLSDVEDEVFIRDGKNSYKVHGTPIKIVHFYSQNHFSLRKN